MGQLVLAAKVTHIRRMAVVRWSTTCTRTTRSVAGQVSPIRAMLCS